MISRVTVGGDGGTSKVINSESWHFLNVDVPVEGVNYGDADNQIIIGTSNEFTNYCRENELPDEIISLEQAKTYVKIKNARNFGHQEKILKTCINFNLSYDEALELDSIMDKKS